MNRYTAETRVLVQPFFRQVEGDEIIIGVQSSFLALPPDAVELLDCLAAGKTVGEAQALYFEKHKEQPDMMDFLSSLEQAGFVQPVADDPLSLSTNNGSTAPMARTKRPALRYHFENFPPSVARVLTGKWALVLYGAAIIAALAALATEPSLLPRWDALFFTEDMTSMALALLVYSFLMLFLHEMAHLVAARAAGIPSRLGLGHRLWILVAETDVSGLWSLPRSKRYKTLLAGPLLDLVSASVLVCVGYAGIKGWLLMPPLAVQVCRALLLMYLLNLLWQCNFFLRTDFYYVLANFFGCKNLMGDTESFLRSRVAMWTGWSEAKDLSYIPVREMRVVRGYAWVWLLGRANMFWILATITLPLLWGYLTHIAAILGTGFSHDPSAFIDALVLGSVTATVQVAGLWMWLSSFLKRKKREVSHEMAV